MLPPLTINWPLSTVTGYGIYGLQIALQFFRRGGQQLALTDHPLLPLHLPLVAKEFEEKISSATQLAEFLDKNPKEILHFNSPVLHGIGNSFCFFQNQLRVKGKPNVGCAAIEELACPPDWLPFLKIYDMFIAISRWNTDYLQSLNLAPVHLCHQGIDTSIFYPREKADRWPGRFVIFSGGKFEFRKGQDIMLTAFKKFRARRPDALLVTSWQNSHAPDLSAFAHAGYITSTPESAAPLRGIKISEWLLSEGLPQGSFVDLPWLPNMAMPEYLQACDVAIFPNRCEGGTNLVAMEAMACGVPTYVSSNTGHKDLIELLGANPLLRQKLVQAPRGIESTEGWGESDLEEIVDILESVYTQVHEARKKALISANKIKAWDWSLQNDRLLNYVYGIT